MEPEEEGDDYADESFETGDSSPEKWKRSPVKASKQQDIVHPTPPRQQPPNNASPQKASVPLPSSTEELIRPCPFDAYNYDDDDEEEEAEETTQTSLKLNPKKNKVRKSTKAKKNTKVQQYSTAETTTYARTEEENDRLVDELLEEYDLLPTKSRRSTKPQMETQPQGNKKFTKAMAVREVPLDENSFSNSSVNESTSNTLSRKGSLRKDPTVVAAAAPQKTKAQPSRHTNSFVMPAATLTEANIATSTVPPKPSKRPPQPSQPPIPPSSRELQRIAVLEEREQALIEAVEDLSNQNDELIKKLQLSMANELQLELRIISLCTKKKRRNLTIEEETEEEQEEEENDEQDRNKQQPQPQLPVITKTAEVAVASSTTDGAAIGNSSRFRSRLLDNIRGGSS